MNFNEMVENDWKDLARSLGTEPIINYYRKEEKKMANDEGKAVAVREGKYFKLLITISKAFWCKGAVVRMNKDYGTDSPNFINATGETLFIDMRLLEEIEFTPGTICQVIKDVSWNAIKVGAYVKIISEYDGIFRCQDLSKDKQSDGIWAVDWYSLKKVEGISKEELDYGQSYISLKDSIDCKAGEIITLKRNDGSICPFFRKENEEVICKRLVDVGHCEVPVQEEAKGAFYYFENDYHPDNIKKGDVVRLVKNINDGISVFQVIYAKEVPAGAYIDCFSWRLKLCQPMSCISRFIPGRKYIRLEAHPSILVHEGDVFTGIDDKYVKSLKGAYWSFETDKMYEVPESVEVVIARSTGEAIKAEKACIKESKAKLARLTKQQDLQELQKLIDYLEPRKYSNVPGGYTKRIFNRLKELKGLKEKE